MKLFRWWELLFTKLNYTIRPSKWRITAKNPYGKISVRRKFHTAKIPYGENSERWKFRMAKIPYSENTVRRKFLWRKIRTAKNPYYEKSYGEKSYGENSYGEYSGHAGCGPAPQCGPHRSAKMKAAKWFAAPLHPRFAPLLSYLWGVLISKPGE